MAQGDFKKASVVPGMLAGVAAVGLLIGGVIYWKRGGEKEPMAQPPAATVADTPAPVDVSALLEAGDLEGAADVLRRATLRAPADTDLRGRYLTVLLNLDREQAVLDARELNVRRLSPRTRAVVDSILGFETGQLEHTLPALVRQADAAPDDLALQFLRATMLRYADHWRDMRDAYESILRRWPAFGPAVDGLLQRFLLHDMTAEARAMVDGYIAAAPESRELDRLEIEMLIGERDYRKAADRLERVVAAHPNREAEFYQCQGDLRLLAWDVDGAISAYDGIGAGAKRDLYVFGALLHGGKVAEARDLILAAVEEYPADAKHSGLATAGIDAVLLALVTDDTELAARVVARLERVPAAVQATRFASVLAFARAVAGAPLDAQAFPNKAASPYVALLRARSDKGAAAQSLLEPHLGGAHMLTSTVSTHVYPVLQAEAARAALEAGDHTRALELTDLVLRPRHYDGSRGIVIERVMKTRVDALAAAGRVPEAKALGVEIRMRFHR